MRCPGRDLLTNDNIISIFQACFRIGHYQTERSKDMSGAASVLAAAMMCLPLALALWPAVLDAHNSLQRNADKHVMRSCHSVFSMDMEVRTGCWQQQPCPRGSSHSLGAGYACRDRHTDSAYRAAKSDITPCYCMTNPLSSRAKQILQSAI